MNVSYQPLRQERLAGTGPFYEKNDDWAYAVEDAGQGRVQDSLESEHGESEPLTRR